MTPKQIELVQSTWAMVVPIADTAANLFYDRLFTIAPEVRPMFPQDMKEQKKKLMATIGVAIAAPANPVESFDQAQPAPKPSYEWTHDLPTASFVDMQMGTF